MNGDHFPYIVGQRAEIFHEGKWQQGCIVAGYRFRDGIVTIQTDAGQQIWCGESSTEKFKKEGISNEENHENWRRKIHHV